MTHMMLQKQKYKNKALNKAREGMALMEVMLAVMILGILATIIGPGILRKWKQVNVNTTKSTMATIKSALLDYKQDMGHFPTKKEGGLNALVAKPNIKGSEKWDGSYLEGQNEVPQDRWGNDFVYHAGPTEIEKKDKYKHFELISYGADGEPGGTEENADIYDGV